VELALIRYLLRDLGYGVGCSDNEISAKRGIASAFVFFFPLRISGCDRPTIHVKAMRQIDLKGVFLLLLFLAIGCTAYMSSFTTPFFAKFSLKELVQRNNTHGPLNCSAGGGGGGGGGGSSIGTGGGAIGRNQSNFHKSESFSCQLRDADQFDEASFIQSLKESVETDLHRIDAKVLRTDKPDVAGFLLEYSAGDITGRVKISGIKYPGNYYTLNADLEEKRGEAK